MSHPIVEPEYKCPPKSKCDVTEGLPIDVAESVRIFSTTWLYKRRIVHFSLSLTCTKYGEPDEVTRIDTTHGTVHQHLYRRGSPKGEERREIAKIPVDTGWEFVHDAYVEAYDRVLGRHTEWIARWDG